MKRTNVVRSINMKRSIGIVCLMLVLGLALLNLPSNAMAQSESTPRAPVADDPVSPDPIPTPDIKIGYDPAVEIPKWIPEEDIPVCEANVFVTAEMAAITGTIDYGAAPTCRVEDVPFPDPDFEFLPRGNRSQVSDEGDEGDAAASSLNAATFKYVGPQVACGSCGYSNPFITSIYYIVSAQPATLAFPNLTWGFYEVAGRVHLSSNVVLDSCDYHGTLMEDVPEGVSLGHTIGSSAVGTLYAPYHIFWEVFTGKTAPFECSFHDTGYTAASNAAIYYNIYTAPGSGGSVRYIGRAWIGSGWTQFFDRELTRGASDIDAAWEMAAKLGDTGKIKVPLNYTQKLRANFGGTIYPLHESVLPSYVTGITHIFDALDSPWLYMDRVTLDHTSVGAMANQ